MFEPLASCHPRPEPFAAKCDTNDLDACARWKACDAATACSGHGSCDEQGACACEPGRAGLDCSIDLSAPTWSDEFDGEELDRSRWRPYVGCRGGGNGEAQCYTAQSDNVFVRGGQLWLQAVREDYAGTRAGCTDEDAFWCLHGGTFRSGRVDSLTSQAYGRFEVVATMPARHWAWPALWMVAATNKYGPWPKSGEIDISEVRGGKGANETFGTIHFGHDYIHHLWLEGHKQMPNVDLTDGPHTYAVEWTYHAIEWFVDGFKFHHQRLDGCFPAEAHAGAPFDQNPMKLILNLAVGGNFFKDYRPYGFNADALAQQWPGGTAALTVDSVRVFGAEYPDSLLAPPPLLAARQPGGAAARALLHAAPRALRAVWHAAASSAGATPAGGGSARAGGALGPPGLSGPGLRGPAGLATSQHNTVLHAALLLFVACVLVLAAARRAARRAGGLLQPSAPPRASPADTSAPAGRAAVAAPQRASAAAAANAGPAAAAAAAAAVAELLEVGEGGGGWLSHATIAIRSGASMGAVPSRDGGASGAAPRFGASAAARGSSAATARAGAAADASTAESLRQWVGGYFAAPRWAAAEDEDGVAAASAALLAHEHASASTS